MNRRELFRQLPFIPAVLLTKQLDPPKQVGNLISHIHLDSREVAAIVMKNMVEQNRSYYDAFK